MFICFDVIHERDGQTDGRTLHDSIDRAVKKQVALLSQRSRAKSRAMFRVRLRLASAVRYLEHRR